MGWVDLGINSYAWVHMLEQYGSNLAALGNMA
jgi:hypothetical protein